MHHFVANTPSFKIGRSFYDFARVYYSKSVISMFCPVLYSSFYIIYNALAAQMWMQCQY
jgi:hypothetical protein